MYTSLDLSLSLNLPTRTCVVIGVFCINNALISSSVTGPVAEEVAAAFESDEGVLLETELPPLEGCCCPSLAEDFVS